MRSSRRRKSTTGIFPYLLVLPSLLFILGLTLYPIGFTLFLSFHQWNGLSPTMKFIGFGNFGRLFSDPVFWVALKNNVLFSILVTFGTVIIGLGLALILDKQIRGWRIYRNVYYFPVLLTNAVVALLWTRFYDPYIGLFNVLLKSIGLDQYAHPWLGDPNTAMLAVIVKEVWQYAGFPMIILLAGLASIPDPYLEAAQLDGATYLKTVRWIILPLLKNVLAITIALQLIFSFKVFDTVWAMTFGGPGNTTQVLATYMYTVSFGFSGPPMEFGYASSIATVMLIIIFPATLIYLRLVKLGEMRL